MKVLTRHDQTHGRAEEPVPLESFPVLRHIGGSDLAALRAAAVPKGCDKGECVLPLAKETSTIVAIRRGSVRIYLASPDGREMALRRRGAVDLASLPGDDAPGTIPVVAQARVNETLVSLIPGDTFWTMTMAHPAAMQELIPLLWQRLLSEERLLYGHFACAVSARLAHVLGELHRGWPGRLASRRI